MKKHLLIILVLIITSCKSNLNSPSIDIIAEDYVKLVLEIGQYDNAFVDAYFGPEDWKPTEEKSETLNISETTTKVTSVGLHCTSKIYSKKIDLNFQ